MRCSHLYSYLLSNYFFFFFHNKRSGPAGSTYGKWVMWNQLFACLPITYCSLHQNINLGNYYSETGCCFEGEAYTASVGWHKCTISQWVYSSKTETLWIKIKWNVMCIDICFLLLGRETAELCEKKSQVVRPMPVTACWLCQNMGNHFPCYTTTFRGPTKIICNYCII